MSVPTDKLKAVFLAALEKTTVAERITFLEETCADTPGLRQRIEAMLRAHEQTDALLDRSAAELLDPAGQRAAPDESLGFLDPPSRPDALGRLGHYDILEVLGHGGFGIVLRAFDETLQRVVAIKVLAPQLATTSPARKRFVREAQSSAKVRHQNVVHVYAVEEQPLPYLVMEFIPGETLQQRCDRIGPLEVPEVLRIGRQIAEGLAAAHATGLVHRDVKPANVLIEPGPHEHVKLTDFGLARAADDASMSQSGVIAGTPMYMAPEQAQGGKLDHRADLFSLGSVLYLMCSGRPPFRASIPLAVLKRVAEDDPRPIREVIPEVPEWLCGIIAKLHAKGPSDRFQTAREVADLLADCEAKYKAQQEVKNIFPGPHSKPPAPSRRKKWPAAVAAVLLPVIALVVTEFAGVTHLFRGQEPSPVPLSQGVPTAPQQLTPDPVEKPSGAPSSEAKSPSADSPPAKPTIDAATWERSVAAMPAAEQKLAVSARLKELNPGYSGRIEYPGFDQIDLSIDGPELRDISPVRAMPGLQIVHIDGKNVTELAPLHDMRWKQLNLFTGASDLSPLQGMTNLRILDLTGSRNVKDLSPLKGLPLEVLNIAYTNISDLSPLKDMKLKVLNCDSSQVSDLSPLKGTPLNALIIDRAKVTDMSPLAGLSLESLRCDFESSRDAKILRAIPTLKIINNKPAADFWKEVDAKSEN